MQSLLVNIKSHTDSLITASEGVSSAAGISGKKKKLKHNETSASSSLTNNRSRVLLLRCAVSALAALATALPNFMHPYIEDSILLSFAICQINFGVSGLSLDGPAEESGKMLEKDIHKSMVVMISSIPPRLCIPKLVTTSKRLNIMIKESSRTEKASLLIVLIRFVELLSEYWGVLDRQAIASNISQLGPLMLDAMGFRYAIEIQSDISRSLDDKVAEGCVQLCLKLTEAEVRAFFVHASEWMATKGGESDSEDENSSSEADISWLQSAKAVSFFHCVAALNEKMRGVFTASMGCIWGVTANQLADVVSALHSGRLKMSKAPLEEEKVSKKRKKIMGEIEQEESLKSIQEYVLLGTDILNSVRSCCLYDKSGFIDEVLCNMIVLLIYAYCLVNCRSDMIWWPQML